MKICPFCQEPIPENKETCDDPVCEKLDSLVDLEFVKNILLNLTEIVIEK